MKRYTLYYPDTGLIRSNETVLNHSEIIALIAVLGEPVEVLEGHFSADEYYIKEGVIRPLPARPNDYAAWNLELEEWVDPRTEEERAMAMREGVSLSRVELAKRLRQFEILTAEDAKRVARGEWPEALLLPMLNLMPQEVIDDAEIELAGATEFERLHPTILLFQQAMGISDEIADEVFGIVA